MEESRNRDQWETVFSADRPIQTSDDDRLGRTRFSETIAEAVRYWRGRDSLVLALYGAWGTGKTSLKNLVLEAVRKTTAQDPIVVEFNPWQFANRENLTKSFFNELAITLGREDSQEKRGTLVKRLRRYAAYLETGGEIAALIKTPATWAVIVIGVLLFGAAFVEQTALLILAVLFIVTVGLLRWSSRFASLVAMWLSIGLDMEAKGIEDLKRDLAASLSELPGPLLVVLDDIDRLTPSEAVQLFQLVKANADFPNVVYLTLFQRETLEKSIEQVLEVNGRDYLEKIVQVGFDIPRAEQSRVNTVLFEGLDRVLSEPSIEPSFDQGRWTNLFVGALQPYFDNLRRVNRFLSTLAFHAVVFTGKRAFEVNPVDLIGIEVLRVFEPNVYRLLPMNKDLLTRRPGASDTRSDDERKRMEVLIGNAEEGRGENAREIIKQLFPPSEAVMGGMNYGRDFEDRWLRELRVCSSKIFDRYFGFAIPEGEPSEDDLAALLSVVGDRKQLVGTFDKLRERGLLAQSLERLDSHKEEISLEHASQFVTALFDIGDSLPEQRGGLFEISGRMHVARIIYWYLLREPDPEKRAGVLKDALNDTEGVSAPVYFVALEDRSSKKEDRGLERLLADESVEDLKQLALGRIRTAANDGKLAATRDLLSILYRWREWANAEETRAYCSELAKMPEGAVRLVVAFTQRTTSQTVGEAAVQERWYLRLGALEEFVDWEIVEDSLKRVPADNIAAEARRGLEAFREAVQRRQEGKPDIDPARDDD